MSKTVGVVGLGIMGGAIARNLVDRGWRVLGSDANRDRCREVDLGTYGNGSRMKYVANLLVAIHNVASAEAMVLAMKAGLDPNQVIEVVGAGAGASRMFEMRAPMMAKDCYEPPTMRVSTWQKDMSIINAFARELGCATPLF
jgi:putative dehydrogenase